VFLTPDFPYYRRVSGVVMDVIRSHVQTVEVVGLDEAYLDLTDLPAPKAAMRRLIRELEARTGLSCSVGIGPNKLVAKVASDAEKPRGFVVLSRQEACARFAGSRCGLIPGIGPKTVERLRSAGISTLGELAVAPTAELAERFGPRLGAELRRRAMFEDSAPVSEARKVISESREVTFDSDIADPAKLEEVLVGLSERLWAALAAQRRRGRTVSIKVRLSDFSTYTRARTQGEHVSSQGQLAELALGLLRRHPPARPVRLLGVRVAGLVEVGSEAQRQLALGV
jgi:DNA polymerase-4